MAENTFTLQLRHLEDFAFEVRFDQEDLPPLLLDEPEPLGAGKGPNASRLLGAAVGNCLSASLLFCLQKARVSLAGMETRVAGHLERNEAGRLRVVRIDVHITLDLLERESGRIGRCLGLFEDYCVVTASVRKGIDVGLTVTDSHGGVLLEQPSAG